MENRYSREIIQHIRQYDEPMWLNSDLLEIVDDEVPFRWESNEYKAVDELGNDNGDDYWEDELDDVNPQDIDFHDHYNYDKWVD